MCKLLRVEAYKLVHGGAFWGVAALTFALATVLLTDSRQRTATLFLAALYNTPLLYFFTIIFLALFVGGDFAGRTFCAALTSGSRRSALFFAKFLIAQLAAMAMLGLPLCVHGICGGRWGVTGSVVVAVGCGILAMNALPWFFAVVFGDFGRALAVSLLCYGVLVFLMNGDSPAHGYPLSRLLPMGQLRLLAMDALPISCGAMIASDILWTCVLVVVAWLIFRRRDFK